MIRRRLLAAFVLLAFAIGSALFWNGGQLDWVALGANLFAAGLGFVFLHFRWRSQERRRLSPEKAKDIFS